MGLLKQMDIYKEKLHCLSRWIFIRKKLHWQSEHRFIMRFCARISGQRGVNNDFEI